MDQLLGVYWCYLSYAIRSERKIISMNQLSEMFIYYDVLLSMGFIKKKITIH